MTISSKTFVRKSIMSDIVSDSIYAIYISPVFTRDYWSGIDHSKIAVQINF